MTRETRVLISIFVAYAIKCLREMKEADLECSELKV